MKVIKGKRPTRNTVTGYMLDAEGHIQIKANVFEQNINYDVPGIHKTKSCDCMTYFIKNYVPVHSQFTRMCAKT